MARLSYLFMLTGIVGAILVELPLLLTSMMRASRTMTMQLKSSLQKPENVTRSPRDATDALKTHRSPNEESKYPSVTWLMSFPNSGTSYTMINTERISQRSTATSYAAEIGAGQELVPIRPNSRQDVISGPWQRNTSLPLPSKRVLCKTHCTGYDDSAFVGNSVKTLNKFIDGCQQSMRQLSNVTTGKHNKVRLRYESRDLVDSAIHLIRDPFDNLISRMHLNMRHNKHWENISRDELEEMIHTKHGVNEWCKLVDEKFWNIQNHTSPIQLSERILSSLPYDPKPYLHVPCHGEFFRYTQWHNHALELIKQQNLAVLTVHYENYELAYDRTVDQILDFLGHSREFEPLPFQAGKTYRDVFFEKSMQHEVKHLIKSIASNETWALVKRYFSRDHKEDDVDD